MDGKGHKDDTFTAECTAWRAPTSRGSTGVRPQSPSHESIYIADDDDKDNSPSRCGPISPLSTISGQPAMKQPRFMVPVNTTRIQRPQSSGEVPGFSFGVAKRVPLRMDRQLRVAKTVAMKSNDNGTQSSSNEVQLVSSTGKDLMEDVCRLPTDVPPTASATPGHNGPAVMPKTSANGPIRLAGGAEQDINVGSREQQTVNQPLPLNYAGEKSLETFQTIFEQDLIDLEADQHSAQAEVVAQQHHVLLHEIPANPAAAEPSGRKSPKTGRQFPATRLVSKVTDHTTPILESRNAHPAVRQHTPKPTKQRELPQDPGRVTKTRHVKKSNPPTGPSFDANSMEDMLNLLQFRFQRDQQTQKLAKEIHKVTEKELEVAKRACNQLNIELQDSREKDKNQGAELKKYQSAIASLKTRGRKLDDYLKGLTNDHHRLRDDAVSIQKKQQNLCLESSALQTSIQQARDKLGQLPSTSRLLTEAKHELISKDQSLKEQVSLLKETKQLLQTERERSQNLETNLLIKLSEISTTQTEVLEGANASHDIVTQRLVEVLNSVNVLPRDNTSAAAGHARSILDRCQEIGILIKNGQDSESDGLKVLDASLKAYADTTTTAIEQLNQSYMAYQSNHTDLDREVELQMKEIASALRYEQSSSEQLINLRETQTRLQTKLQASESALATANQSISYLQDMETRHLQDVADLKTELITLRTQHLESSSLGPKLQAVEKVNAELNFKDIKAQDEIEELKNQAIRYETEASKSKQQIEHLQSKLEYSDRTKSNLEQEKVDLEKQSIIDFEDMKTQLLKEANLERISIAEEHSNALYQMQEEAAATEQKYQELQDKFKNVQDALDRERKSSTGLASEIAALQAAAVESGIKFSKLETELGQAVEDGVSKVTEIQTLKENTQEIERQSEEAQQHSTAQISEFELERGLVLSRINSACANLSPMYVPQSRLRVALEALLSLQASEKRTRLVAFSPQKSQSNRNQMIQDTPQNEVSTKSLESPKPRRKANREPLARRNTAVSQASDDNLLFDECHRLETTTHHTSSYTRTTSRQGREVTSTSPFQGIRSTLQGSQLEDESQESQDRNDNQDSLANLDTQDPLMRFADIEIDSQQIGPHSRPQAMTPRLSTLAIDSQLVDPLSPVVDTEAFFRSPKKKRSKLDVYPSQLSPERGQFSLFKDPVRLSRELEARQPSLSKNAEVPAEDPPRKKYGQKVQENTVRPPVNPFAPNLDLPAPQNTRGAAKAPTTALKRSSQTAGIHSAPQPTKRRVAFQGPGIGEPSTGKKGAGPATRRSTRHTSDKFSERFSLP